jgi:hypothetical protein
MKTNKLDRYETKIESPITPAEHKQNVEDMIALLLPIVEKVKIRSSNLPLPSWAELIDELKNGSIYRQPTIIVGDEKPSEVPLANTKINAKVDTGINTKVDTFTEFELNLLEQIRQNGK